MYPIESRIAFARSDRALTVIIGGELDVATAPDLSDQILREVRAGGGPVWLDLAGVTFCGSVGISLIIQAGAAAAEQGSHLAIVNPSPAVSRVLEMCGLASLISVRIG
ncbi:MAG: hypothetical protein JWO77_2180 [Ilumatobacteraceae bacterium]|nr:hypothetical protein [Ilumatobacteraceae bacterium]